MRFGRDDVLAAVPGCPCGQDHRVPRETWGAYQANIAARMPETVLISVREGSWRVPRLYLALHGLAAGDVEALALAYGWERVA